MPHRQGMWRGPVGRHPGRAQHAVRRRVLRRRRCRRLPSATVGIPTGCRGRRRSGCDRCTRPRRVLDRRRHLRQTPAALGQMPWRGRDLRSRPRPLRRGSKRSGDRAPRHLHHRHSRGAHRQLRKRRARPRLDSRHPGRRARGLGRRRAEQLVACPVTARTHQQPRHLPLGRPSHHLRDGRAGHSAPPQRRVRGGPRGPRRRNHRSPSGGRR